MTTERASIWVTYDPAPSGGRKDIDRRGIDCSNGQDDDKNDRLDGNVDG